MINVVVIEDNDTIREGLKILINETEGYFCEEVYPKYEPMLKNINKIAVNVLLIDIGSSGFQAITAIKKIKAALPELTILILTLYEENDLIFDGLCAGASGYIVKRTPPDKIIQAIQDAYYGGVPMSSEVARKVIGFFHRKKQTEKTNGQTTLTNCEHEILNKLVEGNSFKVISDSLKVGVEDIRFSLKNIYNKLHKCAEMK
jgi:DNA-binding NarL/FixJ family response regulator